MGKQIIKSLLSFFIMLSFTACSSGGGDSAVPSLTISGTLGGASLQSFKGVSAQAVNDVNKSAVTLSDLEIYAIAFTSPPVIAQGTVGADGAFTVDLPGAKGSAVTAVFRNKTSLAEVGVIKFVDSTKKDLNGNDSKSTSIVLSDSVSLGNLVLQSDGSVEVPVTQIAAQIGSSDSVAVGTSFDPTGTWAVASYDLTLPTGYVTATGTSNCMGPCVGEPLSLVRLTGKDFTPGAGQCTVTNGQLSGACLATDGTVGTSDRYALSIWGGNYAQGIGACGGKIGFSADEARAFGHISVEAAGIPQTLGALDFGAYVFSTDTASFGGSGVAPYDQPWMRKTAVANHPFENCRPIQITGANAVKYNGWACRSEIMSGTWGTGAATGTFGWNVGVQGSGCIEQVTGKPVNVTNWAGLNNGTCGNPADVSATYGTGFNTNSCTYTGNHDGDAGTADITFSCSYTGGQFADTGGNPDMATVFTPNNNYLDRPETIIAQNAACSTAGSANDAATLAGYRCYAESYWSGGSGPTGGCSREYNFNWQATTPANFVMADYRGKPKPAFITNILNYSLDGQMATLEDQENEKITVQTGNGSSTFCEVSRRTNLSFKAISATRILVDLREGGRMASTDAACIAAAEAAIAAPDGQGDGHLKETLNGIKFMFYLDKQ